MEILHLFLISLTLFHFYLQVKNDELLSEGMPAQQISTFNDSVASLAVDGEHLSDESCSQTTEITNPWWQVFLQGGLARVTNVTIYSSSGNDLGQIKLLVSNSTMQTFSLCASSVGHENTANSNDQIIFINFECNAVARFVRIELPGREMKILTLCEVKVYGQQIEQDELLSDGMPASQSSTLAQIFSPQCAIEAELLPAVCSITTNSSNPWWQVHFTGLARIRMVSVYSDYNFNEEGLNGFKILVSNNSQQDFTGCASGPTITRSGQVIILECPAEARTVRIQVYGDDRSLSLCEVKIYGQWIKKDELLSAGMPASQSSTYYDQLWNFSYVASLALRPNSFCMHAALTTKSADPWWHVYLLGLARITIVSSHFSLNSPLIEQLLNYKVLVSNSTKQDSFSECASGPENITYSQTINLECHAVAKFVRIQVYNDDDEYLSLCLVKIFGERIDKDELLSDGMSACQSSTYHSDRYNFSYFAKLAVDGNTNQNLLQNSCSQTKESTDDAPSWWHVKLKRRLARVTAVSVYSRDDCSNCADQLIGFKVLVSNSTTRNFLECASGPDYLKTGEIINLECHVEEARIVRIELSGANKTLSLCEVKVYGHWIGK